MDAKATSALLVEAFGDIGLETLAGRHPAWVTIARNFLVEIGPPPVRPDRAVLQIKAYHAREDLLQILQRLSRQGYTIALDEWEGEHRHQRRGAHVALLDRPRRRLRASPPRTCPRVLRIPKMQGALLVATEVGDHAAFERCKALGFTYFQGEYFAQPRTFKHRGVATAGLGSLRRLTELTSGEVSFEDLERIISSDVGLSLKLLRYVNSAFFSLPRNVSSVHEALSLLGVRTVRRWATVMVLASIPDVPDELVALGLRRAHMCEILAGGTAQRRARDAVHDRTLLGRRRAARHADGRRARDAALHRGDPVRAAAPRRPEGRAARRRRPPTSAASSRRCPTADARPTLAGAYRAALEWADETGRAIA